MEYAVGTTWSYRINSGLSLFYSILQLLLNHFFIKCTKAQWIAISWSSIVISLFALVTSFFFNRKLDLIISIKVHLDTITEWFNIVWGV